MPLRKSLIVLLLLLLTVGCASRAQSTITLRSSKDNRLFSLTFDRAYAAASDDGAWEFLAVIDDPGPARSRSSRKAAAGGPLKPQSAAPLHQVVYIKVAWLPTHANPNESPLPNAAIDWFILSDAPEGVRDLLHYEGAGLVAVSGTSEDFTHFSVRNATLRPHTIRGALKDPVGEVRMTGSLRGLNAPITLHDILKATRQRAGVSSQ